jgi:protein required for attachment to host cells
MDKLMAAKIWVVVADGSRARIFEATSSGSLLEVNKLDHPKGRMRGCDIDSDRPGRSFSSMGVARHSFSSPVSLKHQELEVFAQELIHLLEKEQNSHRIERIYLIASPALLGILRSKLSDGLKKKIAGEVDRDLTHASVVEIRNHLPYAL